jgi:hypothetical protein
MKKILFILCSIVGYCAIGSDNFWLYDSAAKTMTWVDETGFENIVKTSGDDGEIITLKEGGNKSSTTIRNLDLSLPIRDASGNEYIITSIPQAAFGYNSVTENIVLPSSLKDIQAYAFKSSSALTTLTINDGLEFIGNEAFASCTALVQVNNFFPTSVKSIGVKAFLSNTSLECGAVVDSLEFLGNRAFEYSTIRYFDGGNSPLTLIDECTFFECPKLTYVIMPAGLETLNKEVFKSSKALKSVTFNDKIEIIKSSVFEGCSGLEEVINGFPDSLKEIGVRAFYGTSSLKSDLVANNLETIGNRAFTQSGLPSFDFEKSNVKILYINTFYECKSMTNVALSLTLEEIEESCFFKCTSLVTVKNLLPKSLKTMGAQVFVDNTSLIGDVFFCGNLENLPSRTFRGNKIGSFIAAKNGLKSLGQYCFYGCNDLTNIVLSATIEKLDYSILEGTSSSSAQRKIYLRNFPSGGITSSLFNGTKRECITVYLPWDYRDEWRTFAATNSGHNFTFNKKTGVLPEKMNDVGTWQASITQNVTWWKESPDPSLIFIK